MWAENPKVLETEIGPNDTPLYKSTNHHQNFLDCIKSGKETICPAEVGHRSISVALLGEIAMAVGGKLKWNPDTEKFQNNDKANELLMRPMRKPWVLKS